MDERLLDKKVIVFDIGNVLLRFDPKTLAEAYFPPEKHDKLYKAVFESGLWPIIDSGLMGMGELARKMCEAIDSDSLDDYMIISDLLMKFPEKMSPLPLSTWLPELKKMGKKLYYLTNYSCPQLEYTLKLYPFFQYFDGGVVSSSEHVLKPAPRIYQILYKRYGFDPADAIFIDDSLPNVNAAIKEGFAGWNYTDALNL